MAADGGPSQTLVRCSRDVVETRLKCSECGAPICPACYVRTAVGLRCPDCAASSGPPVALGERRRRGPVLVAAAVAVALVVAGAAFALTRGGGASPDDIGESGARVVVPSTVLGRGDIPGGFVWILEARRDGRVCTTLTVSPGPQPREDCTTRGDSGRPIIQTSTGRLRAPDATTYITLGQASDRTERVRVVPSGGTPSEIPTLGAGTGLGRRFFVSHTTANVDTTFVALAADGSELGRFEMQAMPPLPGS